MDKIIEQLWVTDIKGVREQSTKQFDRVVTVCQDEVSDNVGCAYNFFNISDGEGPWPGDSSYEAMEEAIDCIVDALNDGERVLVHCHAGHSRSVMACTAALAVTEGIGFDRAFWKVRAAREGAKPSDTVRFNAQKYVNRYTEK